MASAVAASAELHDHPRTCPLCEAMCGLVVTTDDDGDVVRVRGDREDPYSKGYICPKGASLGRIDGDPDRLVAPLIRRNGQLVPVSWDEAFVEVDRLVTALLTAHGRDSFAVFPGNAIAHNHGITSYLPKLLSAIGTRNRFSPATLDNMPQTIVAAWMYGHAGTIPVPDIDRTDLLVIIGANPAVTNGSVGSAPDYVRRMRAVRSRGGQVVVIDPRRTETADEADLHLAVRPGSDPLLVAALLHVLFDEGRTRLDRYEVDIDGIDVLREALTPFTPEAVAGHVGVDAERIRLLARRFVDARAGAMYCRLGTTLNGAGAVTVWLVQTLNIVAGHLDAPGGMMFPESAAGSPTTRGHSPAAPTVIGRYHSRVRGAPEVLGELPAVCMAEEILDTGDERVRGLVVIGGNPARSVPNSRRVEQALAALDVLICVDPYVNETARHADVVLPPPPSLSRSHFDVLLTQYSVRNTARYSEPVLPVPEGGCDEWRIVLRLAGIFEGRGPDVDVDEMANSVRDRLIAGIATEMGIEPDVIRAQLTDEGPDALVDLRVRSGPFGDHFGNR